MSNLINNNSNTLPYSQVKFISLSKKLLFIITVWLISILTFISITVIVTWRLEDRSEALNLLNNTKQEIYQIANINNHNTKTTHQAIQRLNQIVLKLQNNPIIDYSESKQTQTENIHNQLIAFIQQAQQEILRRAPQNNLIHHADQINALATELAYAISEENIHQIKLLKIIRMGLIFLMISSALWSFSLLKKLVLNPLKIINNGLNAIRQGALTHQINISSHDEFEQTAYGFNQMARELQDIYQHLEDKVAQKTQALSQQKKGWEILYEVTSFLHEQDFNTKTVDEFFNRILYITQLDTACLFFLDKSQPSHAFTAVKQTEKHILNTIQEYAVSHSKTINHHHYILCHDLDLEMTVSGIWVAIPIRYLTLNQAFLFLFYPDKKGINQQELQLLELLGKQLAISKENAHLHKRQKQHAVLEERNIIAQRLHDSIAQSLSFINIQFQLLNKQFSANDKNYFKTNITMIQSGIQNCYDDVRSLLDNYRTYFDHASFQVAIENIVVRYRSQYSLDIDLFILSDDITLADERQQTQVLFILQEALNNIYKHAKANKISIIIENEEVFEIKITDDGCGFEYQNTVSYSPNYRNEHIGLQIMQERAIKIGANLSIQSSKTQGTCIVFQLPK